MAKNTGKVTDDTPAGRLGYHILDPWYDEINRAAASGRPGAVKEVLDRKSSIDRHYVSSTDEHKSGSGEPTPPWTDIAVADSTRAAIAGGDTTGVIKGDLATSVVKLRGKDEEGWRGTTVQTKGNFPGDAYFSQNPWYPDTGPDSLIYHGEEARKAAEWEKGLGWWGGRRQRKRKEKNQALHDEAQERMIEATRKRARKGQ